VELWPATFCYDQDEAVMTQSAEFSAPQQHVRNSKDALPHSLAGYVCVRTTAMPPLAGILAARDEADTLNTELPEFSVPSERSLPIVRQQTTDPRSNIKPNLQAGTPVNSTFLARIQYARSDETFYRFPLASSTELQNLTHV
jgi:hypothetical protein